MRHVMPLCERENRGSGGGGGGGKKRIRGFVFKERTLDIHLFFFFSVFNAFLSFWPFWICDSQSIHGRAPQYPHLVQAGLT